MIWNILKRRTLDVHLPARLTRETMYPFISQAVDDNSDAKAERVCFDFERLQWIDPAGVVVLCNLLEYLNRLGVRTQYANFVNNKDVTEYLDDSGFFRRYVGKPVRESARVRSTTVPLMLVKKEKVYEFLESRLLPWIASRVDMESSSLATIKMCLEEIFLNIDHHSEVKEGCTFAQHFPRENKIQIAISDFGRGIPNVVRRKAPNLDDKTAIWQACQEGFTTQTNVRNRGAGIPNLMRYVALKNQGTVLIDSGRGSASAVRDSGKIKLTTRSVAGFYPGTIVHVYLRTDTLVRLAEDLMKEEFTW